MKTNARRSLEARELAFERRTADKARTIQMRALRFEATLAKGL